MMTTDPLLTLFPSYVKIHNQLEAEYVFTPRWHWIRREIILREMRLNNKAYLKWFNNYMREHPNAPKRPAQ